jgi:hypothetical protein
MPAFLVPLFESNDCHNPPGSSAGGEFCPKAGGATSAGVWTQGGKASKESRLPRVLGDPLRQQRGEVDVEFETPIALSQAQRRTLATRLADRDTEMDVALDAQGRVVAVRSSGSTHSTAATFTTDKVEGMHNHPNGAVVQSWADFEISRLHPVTTVARTPTGVEVMRVERTAKGQTTLDAAMKQVFEAAGDAVMVVVREEWKTDKTTPSSVGVVRAYEGGWKALEAAGFVTITRETITP